MGWNKEKKQREEISSNVPITQVLLLVKVTHCVFPDSLGWMDIPALKHFMYVLCIIARKFYFGYTFVGMSKGIFFIFVGRYFRNI